MLLAAALTALSGGDGSEPPTRQEVAGTDLTMHAVPLDAVIFDTFDGGPISLSEATEEQVLALRDAIIPIAEPRYAAASTVPLEDVELVIGLRHSGR